MQLIQVIFNYKKRLLQNNHFKCMMKFKDKNFKFVNQNFKN